MTWMRSYPVSAQTLSTSSANAAPPTGRRRTAGCSSARAPGRTRGGAAAGAAGRRSTGCPPCRAPAGSACRPPRRRRRPARAARAGRSPRVNRPTSSRAFSSTSPSGYMGRCAVVQASLEGDPANAGRGQHGPGAHQGVAAQHHRPGQRHRSPPETRDGTVRRGAPGRRNARSPLVPLPCTRVRKHLTPVVSSSPSQVLTVTTGEPRWWPARCATPGSRSSTPGSTRRQSRSSRPPSRRTPTPSGCRSCPVRT